MVMDPDTSYNLYTKQPLCMKSKDALKSESRLTVQKKKARARRKYSGCFWILFGIPASR